MVLLCINFRRKNLFSSWPYSLSVISFCCTTPIDFFPFSCFKLVNKFRFTNRAIIDKEAPPRKQHISLCVNPKIYHPWPQKQKFNSQNKRLNQGWVVYRCCCRVAKTKYKRKYTMNIQIISNLPSFHLISIVLLFFYFFNIFFLPLVTELPLRIVLLPPHTL